MASSQGNGAPSHDLNTCPKVAEERHAFFYASRVLQHSQPLYSAASDDPPVLPSSAILMAAPEQFANTYFPNDESARKYRELLLPPKEEVDMTIPVTEEQRRAHVRVLVEAFKCTSVNPHGESEDTRRSFAKTARSDQMVECLGWEILTACIQRSKTDVNLVEAYEPAKFKFKYRGSFANRFDAIVETISGSKTICKHLFDVEYMYKIVDDPEVNLKRVKANRNLNERKAKLIKRGKEAAEDDASLPDSKRPKIDEEDAAEEEAEGQVMQLLPSDALPAAIPSQHAGMSDYASFQPAAPPAYQSFVPPPSTPALGPSLMGNEHPGSWMGPPVPQNPHHAINAFQPFGIPSPGRRSHGGSTHFTGQTMTPPRGAATSQVQSFLAPQTQRRAQGRQMDSSAMGVAPYHGGQNAFAQHHGVYQARAPPAMSPATTESVDTTDSRPGQLRWNPMPLGSAPAPQATLAYSAEELTGISADFEGTDGPATATHPGLHLAEGTDEMDLYGDAGADHSAGHELDNRDD